MATHADPAARVALDEKTRVDLAALLNQSLADTLDLAFQTKQAYWNVKGYNFHGLHLLFDDLYGRLTTHLDDFAEQVVIIGGQAMGTVRTAGGASKLDEYPLCTLDSKDHVNTLLDRYGDYTSRLRQAIRQAEKLGDDDTAELYTTVSRAMDKALWMLAAHQEA